MSVVTDHIMIKEFILNHPVDAVRIIEKLEIDDIITFLDGIPANLASSIINHLDINTSAICLQKISLPKAASIVENLPLENICMMIRRMPTDFTELLLRTISEETATHLKRVLSFPETSVGAIMDPTVFTLPDDITVGEALKRIKKIPEKASHYLYILTRGHFLTGVLSISLLMQAQTTDKLITLMQTQVIKIFADADYMTILNHPGWHDYHILPVIDRKGKFLGALRQQILLRYENSLKKSPRPQNLMAASSALGELYRLGFTSLIKGGFDIYKTTNKKL